MKSNALRIALVTGATAGIGKAAAQALNRAGDQVVGTRKQMNLPG